MNKTLKIFCKEPVNGLSHLFGAIAAIFLAPILFKSSTSNSMLIAYWVYVLSMFLLFMSSATYHLLNLSEKTSKVLRILDHSMIFVMIAGTYTPIIVKSFDSWPRILCLGIMWGVALVGIIIKAFFTGKFRVLSTILYIVMGWTVLFIVVPIFRSMGILSMMYMLIGGIFYTLGAVIYSTKKPNFKHIGFHEIFHICVLLGAASMFMMILTGTI